jgi:hypothetical protein
MGKIFASSVSLVSRGTLFTSARLLRIWDRRNLVTGGFFGVDTVREAQKEE